LVLWKISNSARGDAEVVQLALSDDLSDPVHMLRNRN